jgi:hypothetical protein
MVNSRNKGSKNERKITALFKDWTGHDFTRTPASGGLRWAKNNSIIGDITCSDESHKDRFPFTIECKSYREINFEHLLSANTNIKILEFWSQAMKDALRAEKCPILMVRYNGMPSDMHYLFLPLRFFSSIEDDMDFEFGYLKFIGDAIGFAILSSRDFFKTDYKSIAKAARLYNKNRYGEE